MSPMWYQAVEQFGTLQIIIDSRLFVIAQKLSLKTFHSDFEDARPRKETMGLGH